MDEWLTFFVNLLSGVPMAPFQYPKRRLIVRIISREISSRELGVLNCLIALTFYRYLVSNDASVNIQSNHSIYQYHCFDTSRDLPLIHSIGHWDGAQIYTTVICMSVAFRWFLEKPFHSLASGGMICCGCNRHSLSSSGEWIGSRAPSLWIYMHTKVCFSPIRLNATRMRLNNACD